MRGLRQYKEEAMNNFSACVQCGYLFPTEDVGNDPRTPCPDCGATDRQFARSVEAIAEVSAQIKVRGRHEQVWRRLADLTDEPTDEQGG
jgi:predicted  nucleic acid-binding Zn-ribbon protein